MFMRVNVTDVRPQLTKLLGAAEHGGVSVIIARHGKPSAALVPMKDFWRIQDKVDDELLGPKDPETGRRPGKALILMKDIMKGSLLF
ncbi:type II toxin-antitoxin system Phd/YefM family antitoxin [Pseudohalocynthiibacter aestuariivivens]|jgi:prevent-host-death family protein|uniref:Antitoxin n=1 Tax=Pseudohalocynthiibacter aestuariivivens TaxID=1591409 RepID=A0ABV5JD57_9RHOB|nr:MULTISPECIES: type II toxin-antitoxin system Phd/YefM family antitoxin [Pseudohalocynthiibacter]MBS9717122.1 type II toxin-antitoxin system Phd/YefM family antitoxin [Pseudohalocynthiibacter aestuariivivens]MCK0104529.1 type II toxin-antitoxin system Phd/YefM family antitoxin [Pseudohalocynthiibacter sp. F2068]